MVRRSGLARSFDPKKIALWQGGFQRFLDSGGAVARFCAVEHVSASPFYYWQKKIGPQARRRPARAEHHGASVEDRGTRAKDHGARAKDHDVGEEDRHAHAERHGVGTEDHGVFRPVTVVPSVCGVVIPLPGGTGSRWVRTISRPSVRS